MALRFHLLPPNTFPQSQKFQSLPNRPKTQVLSTTPSGNSNSNNLSDAELALDLATEVAKMNTLLVQKEEAMKKSKELLFSELCQYLALKDEEVKKKWKRMNEEEKWSLVKGFVSEWSVNFHPLSSRSVKEMLEEYLHEEKPFSGSAQLFKRIIGFSQDK